MDTVFRVGDNVAFNSEKASCYQPSTTRLFRVEAVADWPDWVLKLVGHPQKVWLDEYILPVGGQLLHRLMSNDEAIERTARKLGHSSVDAMLRAYETSPRAPALCLKCDSITFENHQYKGGRCDCGYYWKTSITVMRRHALENYNHDLPRLQA